MCQPVLLLFMWWVEVSVPACAVAIHVVGRSKCASLCWCYSCLGFEVSVSVCSVAIDVKSSK
jgi:hypothetical protein